MRKILVLSLFVAMVAGVAQANYCARDFVPAAALLYPYGQVGVNPADNTINAAGTTTVISVTNVSSEAQIVHYTLWNMFSQHVVDWDVILTGYDVVQMNMRDILSGRFDLIAPPPAWSNDPTYGTQFISPLQEDGTDYSPIELGPDGRGVITGTTLDYPEDRDVFDGFADCQKFPYGDYSASFACFREKVLWPLFYVQDNPVPQSISPAGALVNNWLEPGNITLDNLYFYVTAEVVNNCSLLFPSDAPYWTGFYPTYNNVVIGDSVLLDATNAFSEAMPAVTIERDVDGDALWNYYDRYAQQYVALGGPDAGYEPLPTAFGFRFSDVTAADTLAVQSNLLFWKSRTDFTGTRTNFTATCPEFAGEGWLRWNFIDAENGYAYYAWDMDELPVAAEQIGGCPISPCAPPPGQINVLPFETQRVPLNAGNFNLPAGAGWMLLSLPASYGGTTAYLPNYELRGNPTLTESNDNLTGAMGWAAVQFTVRAPGQTTGPGYSALVEAATLGNRHCFTGDVLPYLNPYFGGIADGVLNGNL